MKGLCAACGAAKGTSTESRLRDLNGRLSSNAIASCLDVGRKHERVSKLHCRRLRYWKREQIADGLHCRALPSAQNARRQGHELLAALSARPIGAVS